MIFICFCLFSSLTIVANLSVISWNPGIFESKKICSAHLPLKVLENMTSSLECALMCTANSMFKCLAFNFVTSRCNLFDFFPSSFYVVTTENCLYYQDSTNIFKDVKANIAYNKVVYLSQTYPYSLPTSYVVDNSSSTDYWTSCCSTGDGGGGPNWFVIDLADFFKIFYVLLINRNDVGKRLNNFIVGLSQTFSSSIGIQRGQYKLCGVYPSTTKDGGTFIQVCQDLTYLSRYVILQQSLNNEGLFTVCEAKVYAI